MKIKTLHLTEKITIIISITLIIVLVITGAVIYDFIRGGVTDKMVTNVRMEADSISKDIKNVFENAKLATNYLSFQDNIRQYLRAVQTREDIHTSQHTDSVFETLVDFVEVNEHYFLVWIANEKANFYIDSFGYTSGEDYDVTSRPWYDVAIAAENVTLSPPYIEWETEEIVVSSLKALRENGQNYGFVGIDIILEDIPGIIDVMKQSDSDKSYLITKNGMYVYTDDKGKIGQSSMFEDEDVLSDYEDHILTADGTLKSVVIEGDNYYLVSHRLDEHDWKIVTLIDSDNVSKIVNRRSSLAFVIMMVALSICIVTVYIQIRVMTKPYSVLVDYGKDIVEGKFEIDIPNEYLHRQDDMGDLSKAFQSITDTFRNVNTRLEEEIKRKNAELEAQFKILVEQEKQISLGYMVSGVAHEINTPVGSSLSISTYLKAETQKLEEKYSSSKMSRSDIEKYFQVHNKSVGLLIDGLTNVSEIIRNFKMISLDQVCDSKQHFALINVLNAVVLNMKNEIDNHEVSIECDDLIIMDSYPSAVSRALSHLIMNSIKHGFEENDGGKIEIKVQARDDTIVLFYNDNGMGMSKETIDNMYELFYTTKRSGDSIGLGMYIVAMIISQRLNGYIRFVGREFEGVAFEIELPK